MSLPLLFSLLLCPVVVDASPLCCACCGRALVVFSRGACCVHWAGVPVPACSGYVFGFSCWPFFCPVLPPLSMHRDFLPSPLSFPLSFSSLSSSLSLPFSRSFVSLVVLPYRVLVLSCLMFVFFRPLLVLVLLPCFVLLLPPSRTLSLLSFLACVLLVFWCLSPAFFVCSSFSLPGSPPLLLSLTLSLLLSLASLAPVKCDG